MKRNAEMNKAYKKMLKDLDAMLGEADAGMLIAIVLKLLQELVGDKEEQELRTMEIKLNNFFTATWDFRINDFAKND